MPVIKKIKILKNKVKLQFEDGKILEMDKNVYSNFYLYVGKDLSNKEIKAIETFNDTSTFMNYALKLRQKSLYSEFKMREKLYEKGASKEQVDFVIKKLKENDLIDDKAFIEEYIEYYNSLNYGKNKIVSKLKEKGIFEDKLSKINFPISVERKKANNQDSRIKDVKILEELLDIINISILEETQVPKIHENKDISINYVMNELQWN